MRKYRKLPVVVEAEQWHVGMGKIHPSMCNCAGERRYHIHTLEGLMRVSDGDWVIVGVNGETYPCKPDIFQKTYEEVTP